MTRKLHVLAAALLITALLLTGVTLAAVTTSLRVPDRDVSTGNVGIRLDGYKATAAGTELVPTEGFARDVIVECTGNHPVYIRVDLSAQDLLEPVLADRTNWLKGKDGYWYYQKALSTGQRTTNLLTGFQVPATVTKEKSGQTVNLDVIAQAVQSEYLDLSLEGGKILSWPSDVTFSQVQG